MTQIVQKIAMVRNRAIHQMDPVALLWHSWQKSIENTIHWCVFSQFQTDDGTAKKTGNEHAATENEPEPETANDHKERGNECIKNGKFNEAILHYSFAIKLNPNEATFYSNRSLAFLKLAQLYYANEDADKAIQLKSDWAKVCVTCNRLYVEYLKKKSILFHLCVCYWS